MSNDKNDQSPTSSSDHSWDHWLEAAEAGKLNEHEWHRLAMRLSSSQHSVSTKPLPTESPTTGDHTEIQLGELIERFGEPPDELYEIWARDLANQSQSDGRYDSDSIDADTLQRAFHDDPASFIIDESGFLVCLKTPALEKPASDIHPTVAEVEHSTTSNRKSNSPWVIAAVVFAVAASLISFVFVFNSDTPTSSLTAQTSSKQVTSQPLTRGSDTAIATSDQPINSLSDFDSVDSMDRLELESSEISGEPKIEVSESLEQSAIDQRAFDLDAIGHSRASKDDEKAESKEVDPMAIFAGYSESLPDPNETRVASDGIDSLGNVDDLDPGDLTTSDEANTLKPGGFAADDEESAEPRAQDVATIDEDVRLESIELPPADQSVTIAPSGFLLTDIHSPIRSSKDEPFSIRRIDSDANAIELTKSSKEIARIIATSAQVKDSMEWHWSEQKIRPADLRVLQQSRLEVELNGSTQSIFLRRLVFSDALPISLARPTSAASWDLGIPPATALQQVWQVRFETQDDIEATWSQPLAPAKPRSSIGQVVYRLSDNEDVAMRIDMECQLSRQLEMRMRFFAKLDARMDYLPVSTGSVDRFADQLQIAITAAKREKDRLEDVYRIAGNQRGYIRAKQDRNDTYLEQLSLIDERTKALQNLLAHFDGSLMHLSYASKWNDGKTQEILRVGNPVKED